MGVCSKWMARWRGWVGPICLWFTTAGAVWPEDIAPPSLQLNLTNGAQRIDFAPYPAIEAYTVETSSNLGDGFKDSGAGQLRGYSWSGPLVGQAGFYRLRLTPVSADALLASIVLNRLAYGPTPDEVERILTGPYAIGPQAYIIEQLAPEGVVATIDTVPGKSDWQFVSATGTASSSVLSIYIDSPGEAYLDDVKLVKGAIAGVGTNLIANGDFESPLAPGWVVSTNLSKSSLSTEAAHSGSNSLHLVASSGGSGQSSSIWQMIRPSLRSGQTYTLSYWFLPSILGNKLTVRLSAGGIEGTRNLMPSKFEPGMLGARLQAGQGTLNDLRAWLVVHAVRSPRQLLEVLTQFTANHFTTQWSKTQSYISGLITNRDDATHLATDFDFRALSKWRQVLSDPNGTFYDLLKISAESPAMIIYLDTVTNARGVANENYSRELLELFTMGVDNGYDQTDIEQMARAWTGWRVDKLPAGQEDNPFAPPLANRNAPSGYWTLRYDSGKHDPTAKTIFRGKQVDARFGPPHAHEPYQLNLATRSGSAGMQDGYDILKHIANLPYTQEFISVKLCRFFIHENFFPRQYDYSDLASLSPEGQLVRACMMAWDTPAADGRKGNLRQVLRVIFDSDLFRGNPAAQQKLRNPLRLVAGTVRAFRAAKPGGGFTADTSGYDMVSTLARLGMPLFDRLEPDGYSEFGRDWISTAALVERMRFTAAYLMPSGDSRKAADLGAIDPANQSDPVALLKLKLPPARWHDAEAVANYFLSLILWGEGRGNLALDRARAVVFLNSNDAGLPNSSPFRLLDANSTVYDGRVRGMVALLMSLPRFQEQ